jgi:hypothetical protein
MTSFWVREAKTLVIVILVYIFEGNPSREANNHLAGENSTFFYEIHVFITISQEPVICTYPD